MVAHGLRQKLHDLLRGGARERRSDIGDGRRRAESTCVRALRGAGCCSLRENLRLLPYGGTGLWIDFWDGWAHVVSNQEDLDPQEPSPLSKT